MRQIRNTFALEGRRAYMKAGHEWEPTTGPMRGTFSSGCVSLCVCVCVFFSNSIPFILSSLLVSAPSYSSSPKSDPSSTALPYAWTNHSNYTWLVPKRDCGPTRVLRRPFSPPPYVRHVPFAFFLIYFYSTARLNRALASASTRVQFVPVPARENTTKC